MVLIIVCSRRTHADSSVTQPRGTVPIQEGKHVLLRCTYDYSGSTPMLFWYEQYPHEAPRPLLTQYEASDGEEERRRRGFSAKLEKDSKSFHLEKNSSEVSDSALYYCAMRDTASKATWGAAQKPPWLRNTKD
ncbi:transmembrane protein 176A [Platysternon megacephalum]|uniref:Transmembrane protein 176A n=1 Tax=Platysternon megacephalum TaxID=55544 RepID=A0A4D9DSB0_9SAUR|nr:transmembrane protein 176A [Platysternon megacephalum]